MAEADFRSVGVRECGERAVVVKGRASSAERGLLFGRFGTAIVPAVGDPDGGIAAGTAFEDIPEDWVCPLCGVGKDQFEPVEE